eukprot:GHVU01140713.1.p1 GENE.GHVU01140713.1~~GHVU01140713.1.p1  ORF type:complete len:161 (+),score=13.73 GHVU01140713.1:310-792(+)
MISPSEFLPPAAAATCASLAWPSPNAMDAMVVSVRSGISIMSLVCRRHHYYALSDSGFFRGRVTGVALGMMKLPSKPKAPDPASAFPWPNKMLTAAPAIECPKNNTLDPAGIIEGIFEFSSKRAAFTRVRTSTKHSAGIGVPSALFMCGLSLFTTAFCSK